MNKIIEYTNGNALIKLYQDGTRVIEYEDVLELEQPLNLDIRVLNRCSNGYNPTTGKSVCSWCHESQTTNGKECNYQLLKDKLKELRPGIELAIGANELTPGLIEFIEWSKTKEFIVNLTVNQLHLPKFTPTLKELINEDLIKGLGISYRKDYQLKVDPFLVEYPNTILHCIVGIDTVKDVLDTPFSKTLLLGYKTFGAGLQYYSIFSSQIDKNIRDWQMYLPSLFGNKVVSFDNLAIEQLKVRRFFSDDNWNQFYQGEESFYINAVDGYFAPSSRTNKGIVNWDNTDIKQYYKTLQSN